MPVDQRACNANLHGRCRQPDAWVHGRASRACLYLLGNWQEIYIKVNGLAVPPYIAELLALSVVLALIVALPMLPG
jgi:hypothetical protein